METEKVSQKKWADERIVAFSNRLCFAILSDTVRCAFPLEELSITASKGAASSLTGEETGKDIKILKHTMEKLPTLKTEPNISKRIISFGSKTYTKQLCCVWCYRVDGIERKTTMRCIECGVGFCAPQTGSKCWENHVRNEGPPDLKRQKISDESM